MSRSKVMISMPKEFLDEIDKAAREERRSRSEFIREAARLYLRIRKNRVPPGQDPQIQKAIAAQDALAGQDAAAEWNSTTEIRKWRENR